MNDKIKAKIIELVYPTSRESSGEMAARMGNQLGLADVLRAIHSSRYCDAHLVDDEGDFWVWRSGPTSPHEVTGITWNLTTDYDGQTQEMKDFIGKLIGV